MVVVYMISNMAAHTEQAWSRESEQNLVEMWEERPCLFAIASPEHSDRALKERAVADIATNLGKTSIVRIMSTRTRPSPNVPQNFQNKNKSQSAHKLDYFPI